MLHASGTLWQFLELSQPWGLGTAPQLPWGPTWMPSPSRRTMTGLSRTRWSCNGCNPALLKSHKTPSMSMYIIFLINFFDFSKLFSIDSTLFETHQYELENNRKGRLTSFVRWSASFRLNSLNLALMSLNIILQCQPYWFQRWKRDRWKFWTCFFSNFYNFSSLSVCCSERHLRKITTIH